MLVLEGPRELWPLVDTHDSLPVLILCLVEGIQEKLEQKLTQSIINGYLRARRTRPHNHLHLYGRTMCSLSLGSPTVMRFQEARRHDGPVLHLPFPRGSLLVLRDEMTYDWIHGILHGYVQGERLSFTFRG